MASLNAGPEYYAAEEKYRQAKTNEDKLAALKEMLAFAPKHKGSQSILMEIKKKIVALKQEVLIDKRKKAGKKGGGDFIRKQGAAQIALLGFANSGKTSLFNKLCDLRFPSTDVPFETRAVTPGMLEFEKVQLQLLDTPSITDQNKNKLFGIAKMADLALILIDPMQDVKKQTKYFSELKKKQIILFSKRSYARGETEHFHYDAFEESDLLWIKRSLLKHLDLIRIYTKSPRGGIDREKPFVMVRGSTVSDLAKQIHKEFYQNLRYAKVWGSSKFPGQQVSGDFQMEDGDVVELHMK